MKGYKKFRKAPVTFSMLLIILVIYLLDHTVFIGSLVKFGAGKSFSRIETYEWYRFFTNVFFHDGLVHLGANCMALYVAGSIFEEKIKSFWFIVLFYCGHLIANFILAGLLNYSGNIGASAGIFSLIGGIVVLHLHNPETIEFRAKSLSGIYLIGYALLSNFYGWFTATIHSLGFAWGVAISLLLIILKKFHWIETL